MDYKTRDGQDRSDSAKSLLTWIATGTDAPDENERIIFGQVVDLIIEAALAEAHSQVDKYSLELDTRVRDLNRRVTELEQQGTK